MLSALSLGLLELRLPYNRHVLCYASGLSLVQQAPKFRSAGVYNEVYIFVFRQISCLVIMGRCPIDLGDEIGEMIIPLPSPMISASTWYVAKAHKAI